MTSKNIGTRITVADHGDALTIVIDQSITFQQQLALDTWLGAWTGLGGLFGYGAWSSAGNDQTFFLIGLIFWGFFFIRIFKVSLWRRIGKEIIKIRPGKLLIKNAFKTRGKDRYYNLKTMSNFEAHETEVTSFMQSLDKSFWIIGGDTIHFNVSGRAHVLGKQLKHSDSLQLANLLNRAKEKFSK